MIDFLKVGKKIILYRKNLNLTQEQLADKLFVSRQLVSKWENGTGIPSIDILLDLCYLFHITFEELLCLNDSIDIDPNDIFKGHDRMYVVQSIINKEIEVDLPNVFYQLSPVERMMILREIKEDRLKCNISELYPKLTSGEQIYLRKENDYDFKKDINR